jgi:hypothetical protein
VDKFVELGREFGATLTSKPLKDAEALWNKLSKNEKEEAKQTFYLEAEKNLRVKK